jgi:hypothetical protein
MTPDETATEEKSSRSYWGFILWPLAVIVATCVGCAAPRGTSTVPSDIPGSRVQVTYYDRNGDGKVDREFHHYPDLADADWELLVDDYGGRYEKKVLYGIGVFKSVVDLAVPTGVQIEKK